jgi:hypothetical protein
MHYNFAEFLYLNEYMLLGNVGCAEVFIGFWKSSQALIATSSTPPSLTPYLLGTCLCSSLFCCEFLPQESLLVVSAAVFELIGAASDGDLPRP